MLLDSATRRGQAESRSTILLSLLVLLVSQAALRGWLARNSPVIAQDGTVYVTMARDLKQDGFGVVRGWHIHPGYPLLIRLAHTVVGGEGLDSWIAAARGVSLLAGLAGVMAVWWLAYLSFADMSIAFWSAMLLGLGRKFASLGGDALSDATSFALMLTGLCFVLLAGRDIARRAWRAVAWAVGAGAMAGLAYWVRPEGLAVGLIAGLFWVAMAVWHRRGGRVALVAMAVAILSAGAVILPYCLAIGGLTKKLTWDQFALHSGGPIVLAELLYPIDTPAAVKVLSQWFEMIHPLVGGLVCLYLVLWVMGYLGRFRRLAPLLAKPAPAATLLIAMVWVVIVPPVVMRYLQVGAMSHRYLLLPAGVMAGFAGAALVCLARLGAVAGHRISLPTGWGVLLLPVGGLALAGSLMIHALRPMHESDAFYLRAGRWARQYVAADQPMLTNHIYLSFYTEAPDLLTSTLSWQSLQRRAQTQPAGWAEKQLSAMLRPGLARTCQAVLLERTEGDAIFEPVLLRSGFVHKASWRSTWRDDVRQVDLYCRVASPADSQPATSQPR